MFKVTKSPALTDTLIGQGTQIEGKLACESGIRIEGEFRGEIECKGNIIIGECGFVKSNIITADITIAGKAIGNIVASGRVIITSSGRLTGSVTARTIIIHDGGQFNGSSSMEPQTDNAREPEHDYADSGKDASRQAV